jgi:hypothetical protein
VECSRWRGLNSRNTGEGCRREILIQKDWHMLVNRRWTSQDRTRPILERPYVGDRPCNPPHCTPPSDLTSLLHAIGFGRVSYKELAEDNQGQIFKRASRRASGHRLQDLRLLILQDCSTRFATIRIVPKLESFQIANDNTSSIERGFDGPGI